MEPPTDSASAAPTADPGPELPSNRFELELEFVQCLASPAYIHFLATTRVEDDVGDGTGGTILQDPAFLEFLKYLQRTWTQPAYSRFLSYPHCLFFLDLMIEKHKMMSKEWTLPDFRNFCHQQQFMAWQYRHAVCYGMGKDPETDDGVGSPSDGKDGNDDAPPVEATSAPGLS